MIKAADWLSILSRVKLRHAHQVLAVLGTLLVHMLLLSDSGFGGFLNLLPDGAEPYSKTIYASLSPASVIPTPTCVLPGECASNVRTDGSRHAALTSSHQKISTPPPVRESSAGLAIKYYFRRSELSSFPQALTNPNIRLPENDDPRIIGAVKLRLFISDEGEVDDIKIVDSSLPDVYDAASVAGYKSVRFVPGKINGKAVRSQIEVEVDLTVDPGLLSMSRRGG
jgi:TonB family protein